MKSNRKRNVARKARNAQPRNGRAGAPPNPSAIPNANPDPNPRPEPGPSIPAQAPPTQATEYASLDESGFVSQNRRNARCSTGPRTPEGKAASSQNARKHGLSIQRHTVLGGEDPTLYEQLLAELREIYEPRTRREDLAVEDISQCRWALARFDEAEAATLRDLTGWMNDSETWEDDEPAGVGESLGRAAAVCTEITRQGRRVPKPNAHYPAFERIHRYRTWWERKHTRALAELERAQRARHAEANQRRAEAQAQRQAEAHALKQELALAREARQQVLHAQRLANAKRTAAPPESAPPEPNPTAGTPGNASEEAALALLESLMSAPTPFTKQDFLRMRTTQSANGFVSQNRPMSQPHEPNTASRNLDAREGEPC